MFVEQKLKYNLSIFHAITCTFVILGIIFVYSSSSYYALETLGQPLYFVKKQLLGVLLGILAFVFARIMPLKFFKNISFFTLVGATILTALPLIEPLSHKMHGSHRWLNLHGFIFQPSELLKVALVIYLASLLSRKKIIATTTHKAATPLTIILLIIGVILLKQPDFGCLATLFCTTLIMLFVANLPLRYFIATICATAPVGFLLVYLQPYRWQRILTYLDPWQDPQGTGFQIIQSLIAIGSGGLCGTGIAQSQQKFSYLPMQHTDFIFAIMAEEIGFIGSLFFITLCILFLLVGCKLAWNLDNVFAIYLVQGIIILISLQFLINLFVSTGLAPTKGIGLPFISYGNTALVCNLFMIGLIDNAVREKF
ncbi:cell division protein FtsW [candidate division TM6 bacterium RIFCSPHIGHO2_12_FULL_38_8]|nr:MAG: cell division protein FtsW [candidate division TM6 bacterium RIFCSPHIGHO2_12_FULL_38_8]